MTRIDENVSAYELIPEQFVVVGSKQSSEQVYGGGWTYLAVGLFRFTAGLCL